MTEKVFDILIIGGGVNGTGVARDAAGRGYSVMLAERSDLAQGTSSASTKLIHGGLRYLEYYEFRLVREALIEREVLLKAAPHIIWPLRFVLPHVKGLRPYWMVRMGLFLYDNLGGRKILSGSEGLRLGTHPAGQPLVNGFDRAFVYSDCWVQDSRLVVLNAMDARTKGADIRTRTEVVAARRAEDYWIVTLKDLRANTQFEVKARLVVNAAGPWIDGLLRNKTVPSRATEKVRLVKGSHIVVRKMFDHDFAYIFQNDDRRIVFAIPYERDFTLIGTTDLDYKGDPSQARITDDERAYLCELSNRSFSKKIAPSDAVWEFAGVRPLHGSGDSQDASQVTRDYVLEVEQGESGRAPPVINVLGGKLTTFRKLAEGVMRKVDPLLDQRTAGWTASAKLPGGDLPSFDFDDNLSHYRKAYPFLPESLRQRWVRDYGSMIDSIVDGADSLDKLGRHLGDHVYEAELAHLKSKEFAETADDVLWRRSKLGLHVDEQTRIAIREYLGA